MALEARAVKCNKSNFITTKHIYNESVNFIETYIVYFDINEPSNLTEMVPVIGMGDIVSHLCLFPDEITWHLACVA